MPFIVQRRYFLTGHDSSSVPIGQFRGRLICTRIYLYIVIVTRSREKIIEIYKEIEEKVGKIGLEVNVRKAKYMITSISESRRKPRDLKVEGKLFKGMSGFKYLGNMINKFCI
jgi:hypothetical protein